MSSFPFSICSARAEIEGPPMSILDTLVAVAAILAGFGAGYVFRGWYSRRVERGQQRGAKP